MSQGTIQLLICTVAVVLVFLVGGIKIKFNGKDDDDDE